MFPLMYLLILMYRSLWSVMPTPAEDSESDDDSCEYDDIANGGAFGSTGGRVSKDESKHLIIIGNKHLYQFHTTS